HCFLPAGLTPDISPPSLHDALPIFERLEPALEVGHLRAELGQAPLLRLRAGHLGAERLELLLLPRELRLEVLVIEVVIAGDGARAEQDVQQQLAPPGGRIEPELHDRLLLPGAAWAVSAWACGSPSGKLAFTWKCTMSTPPDCWTSLVTISTGRVKAPEFSRFPMKSDSDVRVVVRPSIVTVAPNWRSP